jgi:hypothetical protein
MLTTAVLTASISFLNASPINYCRIPSEGVIVPVSFHPSGKLHIGNETNEENPCFFYDENGGLVTLRMYQSGLRDLSFYTDTVPLGDYSGETWANASIKFAKDGEFNCFRIHMFFGGGYSDWLFPTRKTVNETSMNYFTDHLEDLANNDIYFVLDGYWHGSSDNYWMKQELNGTSPSFGGLLWNETVREDFVWCWNEILTAIKSKGEAVWNHLVFFEPWSEWALGGSNTPDSTDVKTNSQNPFRYNQSVSQDWGYGNASLVSWQNWLKNKYNNNIEDLKDVWANGYGPPEAWNVSGTETDFFESLLMSTQYQKYSYNRGYDFSCWFSECWMNFTRDCNTDWKAIFPDLYVAWDGWASGLEAGRLQPDIVRVRWATCYNYSDILDGHDFGSISEGAYNFYGDRYTYQQLQLAAIARTLQKPYVTGEFGHTTSGGVGYDPAQDSNNIGIWNSTLSKALRYGYAGWCPYWISYWHSYETGSTSRIARCDFRRSYMRHLNELYKAAENWIDKIKFDPIMMVTGAGSHLYSANSVHGWGGASSVKLVDQAGYIPKYWGFSYDNETFYPEIIPDDVRIIVLGDLVHSGEYGKLELQKINDWLNSDSSHKLVLCHIVDNDIMLEGTLRWENVLNSTLFPLSSVLYGESYTGKQNTTDVYVDVDGTNVLLNRSNTWHSQYYAEFRESYITGTCLINYADTNKPMTIINDRIAWIGSVIGYQCGNPDSNAYATCKNGYLIIRKILRYWGYNPKADITKSHWRVGYVFDKISYTYGIQGFYSLNATDSGTITPKFNFTRMGLSSNFNYVVFSAQTKTAVTKTPVELESGISVSLGALNRENLIIRSNESLCYLYSNSYITNEISASPESLTCIFAGLINQTDTVYFYFPYDDLSRWKIKCSEATTLDLEGYYDEINKLIKIAFKFQSPIVVLSIYRI